MFAFRFVAIGPFLAEIEQIPYLTLKNLGQGHDESRPKSNQVMAAAHELVQKQYTGVA